MRTAGPRLHAADGRALVAVLPAVWHADAVGKAAGDDKEGRRMTTLDAATLARLRERYAPEPPSGNGTCPFCGGAPMLADGHDDGGWARWRCPRCTRTYVTAPGDLEVLALLTAYDALVAGIRDLIGRARQTEGPINQLALVLTCYELLNRAREGAADAALAPREGAGDGE